MALLGVKRATSQTQPSLAISTRAVILPKLVRCLRNIFWIHGYIRRRCIPKGIERENFNSCLNVHDYTQIILTAYILICKVPHEQNISENQKCKTKLKNSQIDTQEENLAYTLKF